MPLLTRARRWFRGSIFHVKYPRMKHEENSNRGDREAKRRGLRGTDLDMQITSDGRIVNTHWARPMERDGFRDPYGSIRPTTPVSKMTWDEVSRLRAGHRPRRYRIRSIEQALRHCAKLGLVAVLEPKGDRSFTKDWPWEHIYAVAEDVGCAIAIRALPENAEALKAARRVAARDGVHVETWRL